MRMKLDVLSFTAVTALSTIVGGAFPQVDATASGLRSGASAQEKDQPSRRLVSNTFPVDLTHAVCPGLEGKDKFEAPDADTCAQICENDPGCDLWQWCPYLGLGLSCLQYDRSSWTTGNWTRCYTSTSTSSRDMCIPDINRRWIGGARADSNRVPAKTEPVTTRRGFSGFLRDAKVHPQCDDSLALGREEGWYYTWTPRSSQNDYCRQEKNLWGSGPNGLSTNEKQLGGEFVPMVIGVDIADEILNDIERYQAEWTRANVHYLLGYNEPDPAYNHPQSVEAAIAAQDWVKVQKIAKSFDPPLKLVSPAPASLDFDEDGKSKWLDHFLGNCSQVVDECDPSLIDSIAFHDYVGDPAKLERRINGMYEHYGQRKLWLTEYAIGRWNDPPTRAEQDRYMLATLPLLESHPAIQRYLWFNSRTDWDGNRNLLIADVQVPTITSTGKIYKFWPEGAENQPGADSDGVKVTDPPKVTASPTPPRENDSIETAPQSPPQSPIQYSIVVQYDKYPGETKWLIKDLTNGNKKFDGVANRVSKKYPSYKKLIRNDKSFVAKNSYRLIVRDTGCNGMGEGNQSGYILVKARRDRKTIWKKKLVSGKFGCKKATKFVVPEL